MGRDPDPDPQVPSIHVPFPVQTVRRAPCPPPSTVTGSPGRFDEYDGVRERERDAGYARMGNGGGRAEGVGSVGRILTELGIAVADAGEVRVHEQTSGFRVPGW